MRAWQDLQRGNRHAEDARAFLCSDWAAELAEALGMDPRGPGNLAARDGQLPDWLIDWKTAVKILGTASRLDWAVDQGQVAKFRASRSVFFDRRQIEHVAAMAGIKVDHEDAPEGA